MTEKELIEGCRNGDMEARRELYERYGGIMYGVVRRYIGDRATAEDLLHDGFVTLYLKIGSYRGEGSFEGWCRRIFVNTVLSYLRKRNPLADAGEVDGKTGGSVAPSILERMSADEVMECMNELPTGYRTVINLHAVEGYSYPEIAESLGVSEVTVRTQYLRAKNRLAELMSRRNRTNV